MTVRPVTSDELQQVNDINTLAFLKCRRPDQLKPALPNDPSAYRGAFNAEGRMTATIAMTDASVRFDGHTVHFGTIGGVASLPEYRNQGQMRALLHATLREMYESGHVFSGLFPFSHAYYRKFGYEHCVSRQLLEISLQDGAFLSFPHTGSIRQYFPGQDTAPLRAVYQAFTEPLNFPFVRNERHFQFLQADPYVTRQYTYLWSNDCGEARAYVVFHPESLPNGDNALVVDELAYLDADALFGLFHLFYNLNAQYKSLRWSAPAWLPFSTMFADPYQVRQALDGRHMMMVRVVNVAEALRQMRKPEGRGRFTLAVADPQLTENTGSFTVQYENGLTQVERDLQTNPDLTLSVQALALLVTGSVSWESFRFCHPGYTLHGNADTLAKVFTSRPCLMLNGF